MDQGGRKYYVFFKDLLNNNFLFQLTQLAEASYADFWNNETHTLVIDTTTLLRRLKLKGIGETQATALLAQWSVASHQQNTSNGFSATLFKNKDNSYVLAMRGTEQKIMDLAIADGLDIVRDGLAMDQILDMYNYWQQLIAPKGQLYEVAVLETDLAMSAMWAPGVRLCSVLYAVAFLYPLFRCCVYGVLGIKLLKTLTLMN